MKGKILGAKLWKEIWDISEEDLDAYAQQLIVNKEVNDSVKEKMMVDYRSKYFNDITSDSEMKKHICDLFNINEKLLENLFVINGALPLDNFDKIEK